MFDLSRDFPSSEDNGQVNGNGVNGTEKSKKRKRKSGKEHPSGAGGMVPDERLGTGISRKMQRFIQEEVEEDTALILDSMDLDSSEEPSTSASASQLERLRRGKNADGGGRREEGYEPRPHDWHSFKYRPIMGAVLIGEGTKGLGPEVAVVERPVWDLGLPGRWEGEQEWRDREVGL